MIYRPIVIDEEIKFSKKKFLVSKTDLKGNIIFVNKNFSEISGYSEDELIGAPHNIVRHPDMPKAIFFLIWKNLLSGRGITAVIKNLAKSGKYYWIISDFEPKFDKNGNVVSLTAFRRSAPQYVIDEIEELYSILLRLEKKKNGMEKSLTYLEGFLEEKNMTYDGYINDLTKPKGIIDSLLRAFKKIFR
jgi:PAS domain S-box-containing protein